MRELENVRDNVLQLFGNDEWVKWVHEGLLPAYTSKEKEKNIDMAMVSNHCAICRNVNGCCFPKNNNIKYPLHPNCHCFLEDIPKPKTSAECPRDKFEKYIFSQNYEHNGKVHKFTKWGFKSSDIEYLIDELEIQAKGKYSDSYFQLGKLDEFGQRITIVVSLEHKIEKRIVKFKTGWMVYPDGNIRTTTPFTGEVK